MQKLSFKIIITSFFYFLSIVSTTLFMNSCCNPGPPSPKYFNITDLGGGVKIRNNNSVTDYTNNITFLLSELSIEIYTKYELYGKNRIMNTNSMLCACSPALNATVSQEKVKNIIITSNAKFKTGFDAGSNLNGLLNIKVYEDIYGFNQNKRYSTITDYLSTNPNAPASFHLGFNQAPDIDKKHIFTIRYEQDNGEVYTYTTPEITFI